MAQNVPPIIEQLEDHFASPEHTCALGDFLSEHIPSFSQGIDPSAEQPLHYYRIFEEYKALMEHSVESFLAQEGSSAEELFTIISEFQQSGGLSCYTCIDYLLACIEYPYFLQIVLDMQRMEEWDIGCQFESLEESETVIAEPKYPSSTNSHHTSSSSSQGKEEIGRSSSSFHIQNNIFDNSGDIMNEEEEVDEDGETRRYVQKHYSNNHNSSNSNVLNRDQTCEDDSRNLCNNKNDNICQSQHKIEQVEDKYSEKKCDERGGLYKELM